MLVTLKMEEKNLMFHVKHNRYATFDYFSFYI